MKNILLLISLFLLSGVNAQNYTFIANDTDNDVVGSGGDLKSLEVAIDKSQDSIWFKIETWNAPDEFGYYVFIDMDENPSNGYSIDDPMAPPPHPSPNTSMNFDNRLIWCSHTASMDISETEQWNGGGSPSSAAEFYWEDTNVVILRGIYSDVELDTNQCFNVVVISGGAFFGASMDYMPDNSFGHACIISGINETNNKTLKVYPNPVNNELYVETGQLSEVEITDVSGRVVLRSSVRSEHTIDTSVLPSGTYLVKMIFNDTATVIRQVIKKD